MIYRQTAHKIYPDRRTYTNVLQCDQTLQVHKALCCFDVRKVISQFRVLYFSEAGRKLELTGRTTRSTVQWYLGNCLCWSIHCRSSGSSLLHAWLRVLFSWCWLHLHGRRSWGRGGQVSVNFGVDVYSFIAYGRSKNWIKHYKSRPIHWQSHHINHIINRIKKNKVQKCVKGIPEPTRQSIKR